MITAGSRIIGSLGTSILARRRPPPGAPPAFLLDSNRMPKGVRPNPGQFDNRWVAFPQDFPSGAFLRSRGIGEAVLIQEAALEPAEDLAHVLLRWQEAGIRILALRLDQPGPPTAINVPRPSRFRSVLYRLLATARLRRHSAGGFGGPEPMPSQG